MDYTFINFRKYRECFLNNYNISVGKRYATLGPGRTQRPKNFLQSYKKVYTKYYEKTEIILRYFPLVKKGNVYTNIILETVWNDHGFGFLFSIFLPIFLFSSIYLCSFEHPNRVSGDDTSPLMFLISAHFGRCSSLKMESGFL